MSKHRVLSSIFFVILFLSTALIVANEDPPVGLAVGNKLPGFKIPDLAGNEIDLADYHGKAVIIHLWKCL